MFPPLEGISKETWLNHFQSLHSDDPGTFIQQRKIYYELQTLKKEKEQLNYLDHAITEQEIRQAVKKETIISDKFCKRYLEVNNKASNLVCRAELGRLPLIVPINQKIMKYFVYLNNKNNSSIVKQALLMSKNLHFINNSENLRSYFLSENLS